MAEFLVKRGRKVTIIENQTNLELDAEVKRIRLLSCLQEGVTMLKKSDWGDNR